MDPLAAAERVLKLCSFIAEKAKEAKVHRQTCKDLADYLKCISDIHAALGQSPQLAKNTVIAGPLCALETKLTSAKALVESCSRTSVMVNVMTSKAKEFKDVEASIQKYVTLLTCAMGAHAQLHHGHAAHGQASNSTTSRVVQVPAGISNVPLPAAPAGREQVAFHTLSARSLSITWGNDPRYWDWVPRAGSRFSEVAYLKEVAWLEVNGALTSHLQPGTYTLSWRLQVEHIHNKADPSSGWKSKPVLFQFITSDGQNGSYSSPNLMDCRAESRNMGSGWRELDVGEFTVVEAVRPLQMSFSLKETQGGHWKRGLFLDGVVVRKSSDLERYYEEEEELEEMEVPEAVSYPGHPHTLLHTWYGTGHGHRCDECRKRMSAAGYRCDFCDFDVHLDCADEWSEEEVEADADAAEDEMDSSLVDLRLWMDNLTVMADEEEDESESESESEDEDEDEAVIREHRHPLRLMEAPYQNAVYGCDLCGGTGRGAAFRCGPCKFDVHPRCVTMSVNL